MVISISVQGLDAVRARMEGMSERLDDEVFSALETVAEGIKNRAAALAPVGATGTLRRRIRVVPMRERLAVRVRFAPHAHLVERGRRAGKRPPAMRLAGWAKARGLEGKEYVLARSIGARGTRAHPFVAPALVGSLERLASELGRAIQRALASPPAIIAGGPGMGI